MGRLRCECVFFEWICVCVSIRKMKPQDVYHSSENYWQNLPQKQLRSVLIKRSIAKSFLLNSRAKVMAAKNKHDLQQNNPLLLGENDVSKNVCREIENSQHIILGKKK